MIKNYNTYINERKLIDDFKKSRIKSLFQEGDICTYTYEFHKDEYGHKCLITNVRKRKEESSFIFLRPITYYYDIRFFDVYDALISKTDGFPDTIRLIKYPKIRKFVKETCLELDPVATKIYKDKQEKIKREYEIHDPYGEDVWDDENKELKYRFDPHTRDWIEENKKYLTESYKTNYRTCLDEEDEDKIVGFYVADLPRRDVYDHNLKDFLRYGRPKIHKYYKDAYNELMKGFYDDSGTAILALLEDGSSVFVKRGYKQKNLKEKEIIIRNREIDPYDEDNWDQEENIINNYKWDRNKNKFIKENVNQYIDIDPYGEEDWNERDDIFISENEMGQLLLNITKNHVEFESFLDNQVRDYIVNYISQLLEDMSEEDFEEATHDTPFPFVVIDENDPWKHSKGYFVLVKGVLKIVQWGD